MAAEGQFSISIAKWVEEQKDRMDEVSRRVGLALATKIVLRSPVGNPELWAANASAALQRSQHNAIVDKINANLASNPANLTASGRAKVSLLQAGQISAELGTIKASDIKRSVRSSSNKRLSKSQLGKLYPFAAGKGYVGGRFRGNWQVTIGAAPAAALDRIDPNGSDTIAAAAAALASFKVGPPIYIQNNLPYAIPLEYGHSTQAPQGMVRITVTEFEQIVAQAVTETP